jgi:hypothetical protein
MMKFPGLKPDFLITCIALICIPLSLIAQTGSITGVVKEKASSETIIGANVVIQGTLIGASTNFDGKYEIRNLNPGRYTIQVSFISYETQTFEGVLVEANKATVINVDMVPISLQLDVVDIVTQISREKENILLLEQKSAVEIVQHIGAQELSRKGVGDVAAAVTKVTGISKVEGSNDIYVRGLGDRYNSTQMNGLPIPSNNPEQKNISLDIFSTEIVGYISIDKIYNNRIFGDFAGGNVDISSKEYTGDRILNVEIGTNVNFSALDENTFPLKEGPDYFGLHTSQPPNTLDRFAFDNEMDPVSMKPVGVSFSLSGGNAYQLGKSQKNELSYFATLNFENEFSTREGVAFGAVNSAGVPHKSLTMKTYSYSTNSTGMLNLGYKFNKDHKISYNLILINTSESFNEVYKGTIIDIADNDNGLVIRKIYERNTILMNQVLGSHQFSQRTDLSWGMSFNSITSDAPDRLQNTFRMVDGVYFFGQNQITDNHRYYHYLTENEAALNFAMSYKFLSDSDESYRIKLTLGGTGRYKNRDFESVQYNFRIAPEQRFTVVDPDQLSQFFNQSNLDKQYFRIETFRGSSQVPFALDPQVYGGTQFIQGGYLTTEIRLNPRFTALLGLRAEYVFQEVTWNTQLDPADREDAFEVFPFMPSLTTRYELTSKQNLRFAASKTYTLPQFKERALFIYEEVTQVKFGNPDIYQSDNYNADLKWEYFPGVGELISLGAYGKYILNPINEFAITSATNDISFLNTGDWGYVAGLEFEARKELFNKNNFKLYTGFNVSYMYTEQELNSEKVQQETMYMVNFTHSKARFTGASDWLLNTDLSLTRTWNDYKNILTGTIAFSYFSDRIYAIGTNKRGNIIEQPFGSLDVVIKSSFDRLSLGLGFKNLLNPSIERYQANLDRDVLVISYKKGVLASFNMSYRL